MGIIRSFEKFPGDRSPGPDTASIGMHPRPKPPMVSLRPGGRGEPGRDTGPIDPGNPMALFGRNPAQPIGPCKPADGPRTLFGVRVSADTGVPERVKQLGPWRPTVSAEPRPAPDGKTPNCS